MGTKWIKYKEKMMEKQTQPAEQSEPSSLKHGGPLERFAGQDILALVSACRLAEEERDKLKTFHRLAMSALYDLEDYLDNRADVIDGDYGQPRANREMELLGDVRLAIRMGEKGK